MKIMADWWLAYDFTNYFLCCTVCNQKRKKTKFPLIAGGTRVTYEMRQAIQREPRVLLDPAEDQVEEWLTVEWDGATCRLVPLHGLREADRDRVEHVIDFFGLNLDPELVKGRSAAYELAVRAAFEGSWDELRRMAMPHAAHSLAARFVLLEQAGALPTADETQQDLVKLLWEDLVIKVGGVLRLKRQGKRPGPLDMHQIESLCWALIALQNAPAADTEMVASLLTELLAREETRIRAEILVAFVKARAEATQ